MVTDQELKRRADALYQQYGRPLEKQFAGQYVAISPDGKTIVAPTPIQAAEQAADAFGPGSFLFKLGERAVWRWR